MAKWGEGDPNLLLEERPGQDATNIKSWQWNEKTSQSWSKEKMKILLSTKLENTVGGGIRVGKDYQARIPSLILNKEKVIHQDADHALLVWTPTERITDSDVNGYLKVAKEKFKYSGEQALGLLYWHGYNIESSLHDLGNFTPHPEEWSVEDKILFEQAFQYHGKAFDRIKQMLPEKSMSSLIRYYYKWKKTRSKSSLMDRMVSKSKQIQDDGDESLSGTSSVSSSNISQSSSLNNHNNTLSLSFISQREPAPVHLSDSDDEKKQNGQDYCINCGVPNKLFLKEDMCNTCYLFWKKTGGESRPLTGPLRRGDRQLNGLLRQKHAPPVGMYINHDDLNILASAPPQAENIVVQALEKDVLHAKFMIQVMKQKVEILKRKKNEKMVSSVKKRDWVSASTRVNPRWTLEELCVAAQGVRRYGTHLSKMAELLPTKTEAHIKSFYVQYQKRFGLTQLIKEHDLEKFMDDING